MSALAELQAAEDLIEIFQTTKWCMLSALVLYVCDFIGTMDEEFLLIWKAAWVPGKVLFLLNRYVTLIALIFINAIMHLAHASNTVYEQLLSCMLIILLTPNRHRRSIRCLVWVRFHWIVGTIVGLLCELTLALRLYAMYDRSRRMLALLVFSFFTTLAGAGTIAIYINKSEMAEFYFIGTASAQHMCVPTVISRAFKLYWIPFIVNEIVMFGLAVYRGIETSRMYDTGTWRNESSGGRFLRFLVRDSVLYFFFVNASLIASEMVWLIGGANYIETPLGFALASASIWSQRLLLNVRKHRRGHGNELVISVGTDEPDFQGSEREFVLETFRTLEHNRDGQPYKAR